VARLLPLQDASGSRARLAGLILLVPPVIDSQARMLEHLDSVLSVGGGGPAAQSGQFEDADAGGDDAHTNGTTVNGGDHMEEAEDEQN
jgi:hypothetical protein